MPDLCLFKNLGRPDTWRQQQNKFIIIYHVLTQFSQQAAISLRLRSSFFNTKYTCQGANLPPEKSVTQHPGPFFDLWHTHLTFWPVRVRWVFVPRCVAHHGWPSLQWGTRGTRTTAQNRWTPRTTWEGLAAQCLPPRHSYLWKIAPK